MQGKVRYVFLASGPTLTPGGVKAEPSYFTLSMEEGKERPVINPADYQTAWRLLC